MPVVPDIELAPEPLVQDLSDMYPQSITITPKEAEYFEEVCDRYDDPEEDRQIIFAETGLTRGSACDWAIIGHTVDDSLVVDELFLMRTHHIDQLRSHIHYLENQIKSILEISRKTTDALLGNP